MELTFLTPQAALFAVLAVVPLTIFALKTRRARVVRAAIGLGEQARWSLVSIAAALATVPLLLGVASAQPVIGTTRSVPEREDVEAFFVLDTSRSMLAAADAGGTTRFERAQDLAVELRDRIPEVRSGIVSMTDHLLPHAFPTTDRRVFVATVDHAVGVERPPPTFVYSTNATGYDVLAGLAERKYFSNATKRHLLVVLTDGESRPFGSELERAFRTKPPIETVFVHIGNENERIYETGVAEGGYTPDPASGEVIDRAASLVGGQAFDESQASAAGDALVELAGEGPTEGREIAGARLALMPYVTLFAFIPLAFLLWKRNR